MSNNDKNPRKGFLFGKWFYVVLFLCVAAAGISAVTMLWGGDNPAVRTNVPATPLWPSPQTSQAPARAEDDLPVAAVTSIPAPKPPAPSATPNIVDTAGQTSLPPVVSAAPSPIPVPSPSITPAPAPNEPLKFVFPVTGETIAAFSEDLVYNKTMGDWRAHIGLDIAAETGSEVRAAAAGVVEKVDENAFWGTTVTISHAGSLTTYYANLMKKPVVKAGESVTAGQVIGGVGQTAEIERRERTHLHFEVLKDNKPVNPMDYLPKT